MKKLWMLFAVLFVLSGPAVRAEEAASSLDEEIDNAIIDLQEDITRLENARSDNDLKYKRLSYRLLTELFQERAETAQKSGDATAAAKYQDDIKVLTDLRNSTWDEDAPILEDRQKIQKYKFEKLSSEIDKTLSKTDDLNEKKIAILKEAKDTIGKLQPILDERLDLQEQLLKARFAEDFKTADDIRAKLKENRKAERDIRSKARKEVLQIFDRATGMSGQNL